MKYDCLIIDDELALAQTTSEYLTMFDVKSTYAVTILEGQIILDNNDVALLLLDINLSGESGFDFCRELRRTTQMPILFISARESDDDILMALGVGGDDYIKKPYTLSVLLAKVRVVLKRYSSSTTDELLQAGDIVIDLAGTAVSINNQPIILKTMEYKLLLFMVKNKNKLLKKDVLFDNVWGGGIVSDSTLNVHIRRLREKIESDPNHPKYIKTVWGTGYIFEVKP